MLPLGHLGLGTAFIVRFYRTAELRWVLLGTVISDLIDKPLYYGLKFFSAQHISAESMISCTRTWGHTGLFLALIGLLATKISRLRWLFAGLCTHLGLDILEDFVLFTPQVGDPTAWSERSTVLALGFPIWRPYFGVFHFRDGADHFWTRLHSPAVFFEVIGAILLLFLYRNSRKPRLETHHKKG
jgi:hypothetical protein